MAITYYNEAPYWDDFNKDKNYLRVLFRPGYSVQARELTQLQTAIQAQIERFGNHFFKDGTKVMGGLGTINNKIAFVKIESSSQSYTYQGEVYSGNESLYLEKDANDKYVLIGATIYGATNGLHAKIIDILPPDGAEPLVLYVEYQNSGGTTAANAGLVKAFAAQEYILMQKYDPDTNAVTQRIAFKAKPQEAGNINPTGFGTRVSVEEGVYYVNGCFVHTPAASIIASRYRQNPWCRVVYRVEENKVTPVDDTTLNDNALGTPNTGAPGAHRYQIALNLDVENWNPAQYDQLKDNFILVMTIEDGKVRREGRTEYTEIMKTMAQRTYEESGNYVLNPFKIDIREYLNTYTNGGLYTKIQIKNAIAGISTDTQAEAYAANKLAVGLEPSIAYINGFRVELQSTAYTILKKSRSFKSLTNAFIDAGYGNYITVNTVVGLPDISNFSYVNLKDATGGTGNTIGTARVRSMERIGSSNNFKLYLFDITLTADKPITDVLSVANTGSTFTANTYYSVNGTPTAGAEVQEASSVSLLYKLPYDVIKSTADLTYTVRQSFSATITDGTPNDTIVLNPAIDGQYFMSENASDYIVAKNNGTIIVPDSVNVEDVSGQNYNKVTLYFGTGTVSTNTSATVIASTQRSLAPKTKTLAANQTLAIASPNTVASASTYDSLGTVDVIRIKAVHMSADFSTAATTSDPDISDRYVLDTGQRDTYYDYSTLQLKAGVNPPTGRLLVVFDKYTHGTSGDYFAVSSYPDYEDIPTFTSSRGTVSLRDCLDFRPAIGAFTYTKMSAPRPNITTDMAYYLGRVDKLCLDQYGNVKIKEGVPSLTPVAPPDIPDALTMYTIVVKPYTFGPQDISAKILDHRRYTMRDIGRIEKRVQKLEYYTALSLLEKETASKQILDADGVDRYKNGFVVDSFTSHGIGAVAHPDYSVAVDKVNGLIRPLFYEESVNLRLNTTLSENYRQTGPLVTLNYYSAPSIRQPFASYEQDVNPFSVNTWIGKIKLYPGTDQWNENHIAPDVKIDAANGAYDSLKFFSTPELATGTMWNYWETNWYGTDRNNGTDTENMSSVPVGPGGIAPEYRNTTAQLTSGTSVGLAPGTAESYNADRAVEINVVPYIRSRKIYFRATNLKPNTKFYAFFDGANVGKYVRQEHVFPSYLLAYTGTSDAIDPTYINRNDPTFFQDYINYTQHPVGYTELFSNEYGELAGSFVIPNNAQIKFRAGKRIFTLIDIGNGDRRLSSSYADIAYDARGQFVARPEPTVISPRPVDPVYEELPVDIVQPVIEPDTSHFVRPPDIVIPPPPEPPQPVGKLVEIDTVPETPTITPAVVPPTPVKVIQTIPLTIATVEENTIVVIPPSVCIGPDPVNSNNGTITPTIVTVDDSPTIRPKEPWQPPTTIITPPTIEIPREEARKGWYPIEAYPPYETVHPYLVWDYPPQPRPEPALIESSVKNGWYPSEAYGQVPGGLIWGPPPSPNQSFSGVDTTNNTPTNVDVPNETTTTDVTEECNTAIDIVGGCILQDTPPDPTVGCIPPEEFIIDEIDPALINEACWPGEVIDQTEVADIYYEEVDIEEADPAFIPEPDYFMEYDDATIYTESEAQVSYEAFEAEYQEAIDATEE